MRRDSSEPSVLDLQEIDTNLFVAPSPTLWVPPGGRGVFGGQIIGHALHAAHLTVDGASDDAGTPPPERRAVHSFHSYFLLAGDSSRDVIFRVKRTSDRRTFTTRSVEAMQRGAVIFKMQASFARGASDEDSALQHQRPLPADLPDPESLPSLEDRIGMLSGGLPPAVAAQLQSMREMPLDFRYVTAAPDLSGPDPAPAPPRQLLWVRTTRPLGEGDAFRHSCAAAYFSDHAFLVTALRPHGIAFPSDRIRVVASLDHSMWFHADFKADEWMLYEMHAPFAGRGRGFVLGHLYRRDGTLAVSCAQEGVLRPPRV